MSCMGQEGNALHSWCGSISGKARIDKRCDVDIDNQVVQTVFTETFFDRDNCERTSRQHLED